MRRVRFERRTVLPHFIKEVRPAAAQGDGGGQSRGKSYIMPPYHPCQAAGTSSLGASATIASVVTIRPAIDADRRDELN